VPLANCRPKHSCHAHQSRKGRGFGTAQCIGRLLRLSHWPYVNLPQHRPQGTGKEQKARDKTRGIAEPGGHAASNDQQGSKLEEGKARLSARARPSIRVVSQPEHLGKALRAITPP